MQGVRTRETRPSPDHGHQQQPVLHSPGRIPPPGIPRRDKSQMANDLRLCLDARDRSQKALETHQEEGTAPQPQGRPRAQGTDLSTAGAEHVRRSAEGTKFGYPTRNGPLPVTKHANQPMLPPPTVRFQDLTEPSSPPRPRQWKFGERNSTRRQRQEAIIHPSPREEEVHLSQNASS